MFDPNVSLGNIITVVSVGASLLVYFVKAKAKQDSFERAAKVRSDIIEKKLDELKIELKDKIGELTREIAELRKSDKDQAVLTQRVLTLETEAKVSSLAVLVQRVNMLEKELSKLQELESFARKNEQRR